MVMKARMMRLRWWAIRTEEFSSKRKRRKKENRFVGMHC
jgi:hypothetical protein